MKKTLLTMITACFLVFGFSELTSAATTTYTVKENDTLWKIANKYNVTVQQLKKWNGLNNNSISAKKVLKITKPKSKTTVKKASTSSKEYKALTVKASAYTANCRGCSGVTATGLNLKKNPKIKAIAVDPRVIPLGTTVHVAGYGTAIAADTGGAIKGKKIDVFMASKSKAMVWGVKTVKIKVYN